MRLAFVLLILIGFAGLGVHDIVSGQPWIGIASILLGSANAILFLVTA